MGGAGLSGFNADIASSTVCVRLSHVITKVMACTVFNILNRLEKLDSGLEMLTDRKWIMELQAPIGGKKGLFLWEMLILQLHPWISSVRETSTNEIAGETAARLDIPSSAPPAEDTAQKTPEKKSPEKKSFFQKLFKK